MTEPKLKEMLNEIKELGTLELYVLSEELVKEIKGRLGNEK